MARGAEARLTLKIKKALEEEGAYAAKIHGGQFSAGIPDIVGCYRGEFFGFEVKMPGKEKNLTELQANNLRRIERAGGLASVVTSVEEAVGLLRGWNRGKPSKKAKNSA